MKKSLDIVYAADHAFLFCCCVSIFSLMEQLPKDRGVRLHLLTDESLREGDRRLLRFLSDRFPELQIVLHTVREEAFEQRDFKGSLWSKAACYRLLLPELLRDTDLCLYIDSDTLVVGDISSVWETDMTGCCLAGVYEDIAPVRAQTVGNHVPGIHNYVNSGVLLMNLKLMRERNIQEKLLEGMQENYLAVDQDLLNVVCYGSIRLLSADYNCMPGIHAGAPKLLHFKLRDFLRPWKNRRADGAGEWWRCAEAFREVYDIEGLRDSADWYQRGSIEYMMRRCADYDRIYVVGSGQEAARIHHALRLGKCRGLMPPAGEDGRVSAGAGTFLICATRKSSVPLVEAFLAEGGRREQVFFYERRPLSYYNLPPENCRREDAAELLLWEFGVDARAVSTVPALLELNAARYPDREAMAEWRGGVRTSLTWRELNGMANRVANTLRGGGVPRGTQVALPGPDRPVAERIAALLGIWKAGCAAALSAGAGFAVAADVLYAPDVSDKAPLAEALPHEIVLAEEGAPRTERQLCEAAEDLRRVVGWHPGDRLLVCSRALNEGFPELWRALTELAAAFAYGRTTVFLSAEDTKELWHRAQEEGSTLLSLDGYTLPRLVEDPASGREAAALPLRLLLTGANVCAAGEAAPAEGVLAAWRRLFPHIPADRHGYEGEFRYDCVWYP